METKLRINKLAGKLNKISRVNSEYLLKTSTGYLDSNWNFDGESIGDALIVRDPRRLIAFKEKAIIEGLHDIVICQITLKQTGFKSIMNKYSDLRPSLGEPSKAGPCYLALRVKDNIRNPRVREQLIREIEEGGKQFDGKDERLVYDYLPERGPNNAQVMLVPHAQRRMDERGITVQDVYASLGNWMKWFQREKSMKSYLAKDIEMNLDRGEKIVWDDKKLKLTMVFQANIKKGQYVIVTLYWTNKPDPIAPGSCGLVSASIKKLASKILSGSPIY